ncbi:hypothetical protein PIB30_095505 [Stylosanthes scabra]|uniref:Uncharacterized protein n=1 Tax=Stylosanthes scabra TaxID=79078 RepID=A0ABU6XVG2_9FABA|nr:hypothetical protein [Stylosanthes scabra]
MTIVTRLWDEISHSDPGLLLFDPEIERTLRRARQTRRRAELTRLASDNNPFDWSNSDSDSDTRISSDTGTFTMGERLTLKQIGGASTTFDNQPNRFPELNANFELKSGLTNLLPKFYVRPGEDPIKHIKDFEVIYAPLEGPVVTKTLLKHSLYHSLWMTERRTGTTLYLPK